MQVLLAIYMSDRKNTTRQRLIQTAIRLFLAQGVTETTTRQIAELAAVNEVTLFRNFGNKTGLLLAVIEDPELWKWLGTALAARSQVEQTCDQALRNYAQDYLQVLAQAPEFVRSMIGEAGKFPPELRQALNLALTQVNRYTAQYLTTVLPAPVPAAIVSLLNELLLGYAILEFSRESLEQDQDLFLTNLVALFSPVLEQSNPPFALSSAVLADSVPAVNDLPASLVQALLQHAKKAGAQDYAIAYVLFAAGLSVEETVSLRRSHWVAADPSILQGVDRPVLLNQWIMGQRHGSRSRNPLTQWLKTRKDDQKAMFLGEMGQPLLSIELRLRWQIWVEELVTPTGERPAIEQAQQTWCVDMLTKGVSLEDLSILSGKSLAQLQPYVRRVREKLALEQALRLDQKSATRAPIPTATPE